MPEKKSAPKKAAPKKEAPKKESPKKKEVKRYISTGKHLLVHVIRTPNHEWRARQMLTDGRYVWKIPADEVKAFEAHDAFKSKKVIPYDG